MPHIEPTAVEGARKNVERPDIRKAGTIGGQELPNAECDQADVNQCPDGKCVSGRRDGGRIFGRYRPGIYAVQASGCGEKIECDHPDGRRDDQNGSKSVHPAGLLGHNDSILSIIISKYIVFLTISYDNYLKRGGLRPSHLTLFVDTNYFARCCVISVTLASCLL